jgi:AsmA-like protein
MKKLLGVGCAAALALVAVLLGAGAWLVSRLDTPQFQKAVLEQAKATLGTDLRVKEMKVSLLSGVTLKAIAVQNPAPFHGDLLTADAFVLRYRLLPLLAGRVEVERLALEKPALKLAMDTKGALNYEKLVQPAPKGAPAAGSASRAVAAPLHVVMRSLAVEDGAIQMLDYAKARLMSVEGIDFKSAFEMAGGGAVGAGQVTVAKASFGDVLFVRGVKAPLSVSKDKLTLSPIRGELGGGSLSGDLNADLKAFRFVTNVALEGASVKKLLEEAKSAALVSGTLAAKARFEGSGGLPTMRGEGSAEIASCRAENSRVLGLLASVLQVPELAHPDFKTCRVEFKQTGVRFATPVVNLTGDALRLTGAGTLNLDSSALDYDMNLALSPKLYAKVTRPELRGAFQEQADGFATLAFKLTGTTLEPKTDILSRLGKAAAVGALKSQIGKLFGKKKGS